MRVRPKQPAVHGEYNRDGYEVWSEGHLLYAAGNHVHDSTQPALCHEDRLPLRAILSFCIKTTREIALGRGGRFAGVERVAEGTPEGGGAS
jgi:hypothetical protein